MKEKCLACGVEKDMEINESYPYKEDGFVDEPMEPLLGLDCEPWEDVAEPDRKWRRVTVCHECYHKLSPDMWISSRCWKILNPVTPFEALPLLPAKEI
jgi:hypothetical protein